MTIKNGVFRGFFFSLVLEIYENMFERMVVKKKKTERYTESLSIQNINVQENFRKNH